MSFTDTNSALTSVPADSREPVIVCRDVTAGYGHEPVLRELSLTIPKGTLTLLVGANGAGKTTLIKAILGLLRVQSGIITTPFSHKPCGYVPQQRSIDHLFPLSLRDIVAMGLYNSLGWWRPIRGIERNKLFETLDRFQLLKHSSKLFSELSAGMRQKTLIARAFVSGADVFILDEPTSELDERSEGDVAQHLHLITREQGKTVIIVHHGVGFTVEQPDLVFLIKNGTALSQTIGNGAIFESPS